jgi:thiol-disulfide isomerase/thioredoxin
MSITLIDATNDSVIFTWPPTEGAERYILEYKRKGDSEFVTLTDKLETPQARKRNLEDPQGQGFFFRAGALKKDAFGAWMSHSEPFHLLSESETKTRMAAPTLSPSYESLLISWEPVEDATNYVLQMRENSCGVDWSTVGPPLTGHEVRKKNLSSKQKYQFRVRPLMPDKTAGAFSGPSTPTAPSGLSTAITRMFQPLESGTLLRGSQAIPLAQAMGGKEFVLFYASAHWCGPCRSATPQLVNWYNAFPSNKRPFEVVFLSADRDEQGMKDYYKSMPWLAVDFNDDGRERLMDFIKVKGIPQLAVLDAKTGRIIDMQAFGKPLDVNVWRTTAARM